MILTLDKALQALRVLGLTHEPVGENQDAWNAQCPRCAITFDDPQTAPMTLRLQVLAEGIRVAGGCGPCGGETPLIWLAAAIDPIEDLTLTRRQRELGRTLDVLTERAAQRAAEAAAEVVRRQWESPERTEARHWVMRLGLLTDSGAPCQVAVDEALRLRAVHGRGKVTVPMVREAWCLALALQNDEREAA